jgi:hypothetical protein
MSRLERGDTVPAEYWGTRPLFGEPCPPAWYILTCGRQRREMARARDRLRDAAAEAWFPQVTEYRTLTRTSAGRSRQERVPVKRPIIPGMIFARLEALPMWDELAERWAIRPMLILGRPVIARERDLLCMADMPEVIAAAVAAEAEAKRLRPGDRAAIIDGLLLGAVTDPVEIVALRKDGLLIRTSGGVNVVVSGDTLRKITTA